VTGGKLFVNQGGGGHWLEVRLSGDGRRVKPFRHRCAGSRQAEISGADAAGGGGTGEGNQNDLTLHFGLGAQSKPVNLEVFWPDRTVQIVKDVPPDRLVDIEFKPPAAPSR